MQIIQSKAEWVGEATNDLSLIEMAGRCCYKSEPKGQPMKFVKGLISKGHLSVLEHSNCAIELTHFEEATYDSKYLDYDINLNAQVGNFRAWLDVGLELEDLLASETPIPKHLKRYTAHVVCDRGVLAEWTRHRTKSYSVESTRYCNYSMSGISFIAPEFITRMSFDAIERLRAYLNSSEMMYKSLLEEGLKPQDARYVLPIGLATEMYVTGNVDSWMHFFKLRNSNAAHPEIQKLASILECNCIFSID